MKKLIFSLLIWCFWALSGAAFIPQPSWVLREMAKHCGFTSSLDVPGIYQKTAEDVSVSFFVSTKIDKSGINLSNFIPAPDSKPTEIPRSMKLPLYFLSEFMACQGAHDHDKVAAFTKYLTLRQIKAGTISLGFFQNQIAYIIGEPSGPRLLIDKYTFLPLEEIGDGFNATFANWQNVLDDKKMLPTKISITLGSETSHLDFADKITKTGKSDEGIFR